MFEPKIVRVGEKEVGKKQTVTRNTEEPNKEQSWNFIMLDIFKRFRVENVDYSNTCIGVVGLGYVGLPTSVPVGFDKYQRAKHRDSPTDSFTQGIQPAPEAKLLSLFHSQCQAEKRQDLGRTSARMGTWTPSARPRASPTPP